MKANRQQIEVAAAVEPVATTPRHDRFILSATLAVSFSGVAYELLLATYATYLWGGSIFQYSLVFSSMMLSMGLGSWVSDRQTKIAAVLFLSIETALAGLGVICLPLLYTAYWKGFAPMFVTLGFSLGFGFLVGLEIPLLNRWLSEESKLSELLSLDFAGGFLGGILFPLFLAPHLGLFRVAGLVALLNGAVAWWGARRVQHRGLEMAAALACALALAFLWQAPALQGWLQLRYFGF